MVLHLLAITIGLILDRIIGDPPNWPHPVRWLGTFVAFLTKRLNKGQGRKGKGFLLVVLVLLLSFTVTFLVVQMTYAVHVGLGLMVESILIAIGLSQKSLQVAAMEVYSPLVEGNMEEARRKLSWIVGRDTENLNESEITRGVVETVSENISDGITAPLFFAFLFGAPGLWVYKSINTLDSMVGYRNEEFEDFGFASAKLDDIANFIPSRLTGLMIMLGGEKESTLLFRDRMKRWLEDARKHPSPNSGYLEAATAYQLGIQLGGRNTYKGIVSMRALMGEKEFPLSAAHILKAIAHCHTAVFLFWLLLIVLGGVVIVVT